MKKLFWALACLAWIAARTASAAGVEAAQDPDPDYDRLDGRGASGKRVNVIEWEGNLEVHVYPAGSLSGLALKLDKNNAPKKQLIRRAILGIPMHEGYHAYRDTSTGGEYDKVVVSNNGLSGEYMAAFQLDPEPTQLYPDGHPMLAQQAPADSNNEAAPAARTPDGSQSGAQSLGKVMKPADKDRNRHRRRSHAPAHSSADDDADGSIRAFGTN
jgi:hypothetical protein